MKYVRIEGGKKLGSYIEPMKAQPSERLAFDDKDWIFEVKWDGYRAIAEIGGATNKLYSRNGLSFDKAYTKVFEALAEIPLPAIVDGEIVVFDESGKPNFQKLQNYKNTQKYTIQFQLFDVLEINGQSVANLPLINRKELLKELVPDSAILKYCDHIDGMGKQLFEQMKDLGLEGIIAKRKASKYIFGKRSGDWLKVKNIKSMEAVIVGFTAPKGSRVYFGSLILAVYDDDNNLTSIGNVGTGFTDQSLKDLHSKLKKILSKQSPLDTPIKSTPDITWTEAKLVCTIAYSEITDDGSVRHPVFQGLRRDKTAKDLWR